MTLAWHFTRGALRDGRPIPQIGETLRHDGKLILCEAGLHAREAANQPNDEMADA